MLFNGTDIMGWRECLSIHKRDTKSLMCIRTAGVHGTGYVSSSRWSEGALTLAREKVHTNQEDRSPAPFGGSLEEGKE